MQQLSRLHDLLVLYDKCEDEREKVKELAEYELKPIISCGHIREIKFDRKKWCVDVTYIECGSIAAGMEHECMVRFKFSSDNVDIIYVGTGKSIALKFR